jgi:hypothetical protein
MHYQPDLPIPTGVHHLCLACQHLTAILPTCPITQHTAGRPSGRPINPPLAQLADPPLLQLVDPPPTQLTDPPLLQLVDPPLTLATHLAQSSPTRLQITPRILLNIHPYPQLMPQNRL